VAHATDRQALVDGATEGLTSPADTIVLREVEYYQALDRVLTKYPHDLRRSRQLMSEAGFAPGSDGFFTSATDGRFTLDAMTVQGARNDIELTVLTDVLRRDGIDAQLRLLTRAQRTNDPMVVGNFPGMFIGHNTGAVDPPLRFVRTEEIVRAETRGRGSNWSGVSHPEVDRLVHAYETTLDRSQRNQYLVEMLKVLSEEVPFYALYYSLSILAHAGNLRGPVASVSNDVATWNLHEWQWKG
jgi:ABC-type transport system substrate-binding protein